MGANGKSSYYSQEQRFDYLRVLESQGGYSKENMKKTNEITGMNPKRVTVQSWMKKYGDAVFNRQKFEIATAEVIQDFTVKQREVIDRSYEVMSKALDRASEIIPSMTNGHALATLIRELNRVCLSIPSDAEGDKGESRESIVKKITNQLTINNYGKKDN